MEALYRFDGAFYDPADSARSPWSSRGQHGGPPCALLARAVEGWIDDPELQPVRLTVDLFRQVPMSPLGVQVEPIRSGHRLVAVRASLFGDDREVTRATALLIRRSEKPPFETPSKKPAGPEGLQTEPLLPADRRDDTPPGFHTHVEVRWARREGLPAAWIRMPMPLLEGEETSPLQRAAALSDFANALANVTRYSAGYEGAHFINTDLTLYLSRPPIGEWICLAVENVLESEGVGLVQVAEYDTAGRFGSCVQARLAQPSYPRPPGSG